MKILILSLFLASGNAWAQSPPLELRTKAIPPNKKFEDNREITDAKLRAEAGSMSRYSFKMDLTYTGAAVATPFAKEQPNPEKLVRVNATQLTASVGGRYRMSPNSSIFLGTGLSALHPFHGDGRWDVKNPSLGYDFVDRLGDVQMRIAMGANIETTPEMRNVAQTGGLNLINSFVRNIGSSGFALGADIVLIYKIFNRNYQTSDRFVARDFVFVSPVVKYNFSDRLNLSTNIAKPFIGPRSVSDEWALQPQPLTQRLTLGYAYSKDVYIAPFINLYPEKFAWNTTTLNFMSVFSVL